MLSKINLTQSNFIWKTLKGQHYVDITIYIEPFVKYSDVDQITVLW